MQENDVIIGSLKKNYPQILFALDEQHSF